MYRTDFGMAMGGNVAYCKFTVPYSDLTSFAATSQQIPLVFNTLSNIPGSFQIPQGGAMCGAKVHATVAFAGPSISAMTVSLGVTGTATFFTAAFDIFQAVGNTVLQETSMFKSGSAIAVTVLANFVATGANLSALNAGSVDLYIYWLNVSTPNA